MEFDITAYDMAAVWPVLDFMAPFGPEYTMMRCQAIGLRMVPYKSLRLYFSQATLRLFEVIEVHFPQVLHFEIATALCFTKVAY